MKREEMKSDRKRLGGRGWGNTKRDGMGWEEAGQNGVGSDGKRWDQTGRDWVYRRWGRVRYNGTGWGWMGLDGVWDAMERGCMRMGRDRSEMRYNGTGRNEIGSNVSGVW